MRYFELKVESTPQLLELLSKLGPTELYFTPCRKTRPRRKLYRKFLEKWQSRTLVNFDLKGIGTIKELTLCHWKEESIEEALRTFGEFDYFAAFRKDVQLFASLGHEGISSYLVLKDYDFDKLKDSKIAFREVFPKLSPRPRPQ